MPSTGQLDRITTFPELLTYLEDELGWPIEANSFDDVTFDYTPADFNLKPEELGGGVEIKQLRPLTTNQPWGIFFLGLPHKTLPVTVLRRILGQLAVKKRKSSNPADRAVFEKSDLLFIAATGAGGERRLAFAHFRDDPSTGNAPTLQVLGWDADDTVRRLSRTHGILTDKLAWPDDGGRDADDWRTRWSSAFTERKGEVIRTAKEMATALAALARSIRDRAKTLLDVETESGPLRTLHKAFREALIHDLTPHDFADMYAQTIAYGLLSARISRPAGVTADDPQALVPLTSPFLKEMFGTFMEAGGRKRGYRPGTSLDFDELGVGAIVDLLNAANMEAVLDDFDKRNPDEDPVIRFYEDFLDAYDKGQKVKRGVFYTPRPVVGFIVRSVDEVLRTEFGLEDGLASTATWAEVIAAKPEIKLPNGAKPSDPFVRILDPATGTGTFLVECIDLIHKTMAAKWKKAGKRAAEIKALWNDYVPAHLLPRLTGFELMMAPYAIAHVKLGLKLHDTGYDFGREAQARVYLTNALEPAQDKAAPQFDVMDDALAHEARAANRAKAGRYTVVIGNPPYSVKTYNKGAWISSLMEVYKTTVRSEESQIQSLSNDYIKFVRFAQFHIDQSGLGSVGMITGHGYLHGTQPRDMRLSLITTYQDLKLLDLNGSIRRAGTGEAGDEPVFEIATGVAISIMTRHGVGAASSSFFSKRGATSDKFEMLTQATSGSLIYDNTLSPRAPNYQFREVKDAKVEYHTYAEIPSLFGTGNRSTDKEHFWSTGFTSQQDDLAISFDETETAEKMRDLAASPSFAALNLKYRICTTNQWNFPNARSFAKTGAWKKSVVRVQYRPFDQRVTVLSRHVVTILRDEVQSHLDLVSNCALVVSRAVNDVTFAHVSVSALRVDKIYISSKTSTNAYVFPLWLKPQGTETRTLPNIAPAFANRIATLTGLTWDDCVEGARPSAPAGAKQLKPRVSANAVERRERGKSGESFGPRDLFDYIYAVLHSPAYRQRYADYLKSDFARIPLPGSRALFEALVPLGTELVALHLLDADALPILKDPAIRVAGSGATRIALPAARFEKDAFTGDRMYISDGRWFEPVPQVAADFHVGGYRPARKWLKDRAGKKGAPGRLLTAADILHYRRIIVALTRTAALMPQIDTVIDEHGGWPGAFRGMTDARAAAA